MKKSIVLMMAGILCMCLLAGCGSRAENTAETKAETAAENMTETTAETKAESTAGSEQEAEELLSGMHHVKIYVKDMGTISVELDADNAPITVTNFINLAESGFYDGLAFHRIISGFMIQGGDPLGNGTGGSDEPITGEFSDNGIDNPLSHTKGAISMARSMDYNSASSQFFIVHEDSTYLDGQYAVFGYVTEGMEIVDKICEVTTGQDGNGIVPEENRPVIEKIEVVD